MSNIKYFFTEFSLKLSFFFLEVSEFFHSLPIAFLKPGQLIELNNRHYRKSYILDKWNESSSFKLSLCEQKFSQKYGFKQARILVAGSGTGRESIALAKEGFCVTGIDSSPDMLKIAINNSIQAEVKADFLALSLYDIDKLTGRFDLVMLGSGYGMIPTEKLRRLVLKKIAKVLNPGSAVYLEFADYQPSKYSSLRYFLYKIIAYLLFGNYNLERGDIILGTGEFFHYFDSMDRVIKEIEEAGFWVDTINKEENAIFIKIKS